MHHRCAIPRKAGGHLPHRQTEGRMRHIHADLPDPRHIAPAPGWRTQFLAIHTERRHEEINQRFAQLHAVFLPLLIRQSLNGVEKKGPPMSCRDQPQSIKSICPRMNDIR